MNGKKSGSARFNSLGFAGFVLMVAFGPPLSSGSPQIPGGRVWLEAFDERETGLRDEIAGFAAGPHDSILVLDRFSMRRFDGLEWHLQSIQGCPDLARYFSLRQSSSDPSAYWLGGEGFAGRLRPAARNQWVFEELPNVLIMPTDIVWSMHETDWGVIGVLGDAVVQWVGDEISYLLPPTGVSDTGRTIQAHASEEGLVIVRTISANTRPRSEAFLVSRQKQGIARVPLGPLQGASIQALRQDTESSWTLFSEDTFFSLPGGAPAESTNLQQRLTFNQRGTHQIDTVYLDSDAAIVPRSDRIFTMISLSQRYSITFDLSGVDEYSREQICAMNRIGSQVWIGTAEGTVARFDERLYSWEMPPPEPFVSPAMVLRRNEETVFVSSNRIWVHSSDRWEPVPLPDQPSRFRKGSRYPSVLVIEGSSHPVVFPEKQFPALLRVRHGLSDEPLRQLVYDQATQLMWGRTGQYLLGMKSDYAKSRVAPLVSPLTALDPESIDQLVILHDRVAALRRNGVVLSPTTGKQLSCIADYDRVTHPVANGRYFARAGHKLALLDRDKWLQGDEIGWIGTDEMAWFEGGDFDPSSIWDYWAAREGRMSKMIVLRRFNLDSHSLQGNYRYYRLPVNCRLGRLRSIFVQEQSDGSEWAWIAGDEKTLVTRLDHLELNAPNTVSGRWTGTGLSRFHAPSDRFIVVPFPWSGQLRLDLDPGERDIREAVPIEYRLDGGQWLRETDSLSIAVHDTGPGLHTLEVRRSLPIGGGAISQFRFEYGYPWYRSAEAYFAYGGAIIMLLLLGVLVRSSFERRARDRLKREVELATRALVVATDRERAVARKLVESTGFVRRFVANLSHELRNPLNVVITSTELLKTSPAGSMTWDPVLKQAINGIEVSALEMEEFISDLLELSKLETGELQLDNTVFDPREPIRRVVDSQGQVAARQRKPLRVNIAGDLPEAVAGDCKQVSRVVTNFVSNAIRYADEGFVSVSVNATPLNNHTVSLEYAVEDQGPGIPHEEKSRIFERYYQSRGSTRSPRSAGSGIGLSYVSELARLMNAQTGVRDSPGGGSCFFFVVRLKLPTEEELDAYRSMAVAQPARSQSVGADRCLEEHKLADLHDLHVLIADDVSLNRSGMVNLLKLVGINCDTVEDGTSALEALEHNSYDLAFLDWEMPGLNGIQVAESYHRFKGARCSKPAFIAVTAYSSSEFKAQCQAAGFRGFLGKPVTLPRLTEAILRALDQDSRDQFIVVDGSSQPRGFLVGSEGVHNEDKTVPIEVTLGMLESCAGEADTPFHEFVQERFLVELNLVIEQVRNATSIAELRKLIHKSLSYVGWVTKAGSDQPLRELQARLKEIDSSEVAFDGAQYEAVGFLENLVASVRATADSLARSEASAIPSDR